MNRLKSVAKPLMWFMALVLATVVAGCGGDNGSPALSSAKGMTAYSLAGNVGTINETAKSIAVTVPFATNVTALVATFTTSDGTSVKIGTVAQVSGTTANDFNAAKAYIVTAADGSMATYTVTVTVALNSAKAITAYSLAGVTGTIDQAAKTIAVTVPFATNVTNLVATFSTTGASVKIGTVAQVSGTTANDFTTAKAYIVTAADGSMATYTVTVTVALNYAKAITAYSFAGFAGNAGVIDETAKTIAVALPIGTDVTALVANFTTTGASVKIGTAVQTSGTTANNFTTSKAYLVTAADSTTATYTVTVTLAAAGPVVCGGASGTNCVNLLTAANYAILDEATVTFTPIATSTTVPTITGNVGVSPAAASFMTGFALALDPAKCFSTSTRVTGKLYAADYSSVNGCATATTDTATILTAAVGDKNAAYSAAAAKPTSGGGLPTGGPKECPGVGAMSDVNNALTAGGGFPVSGLPAGVYTCGVNITIPGTLTLNGSATDVWVFKTTGTLNQSTNVNVLLTGGALPQNVFWQVAGGVAIQAGAHMEGVVMSATNIQLVTGATVKGRLLAKTGVLMDNNTVTQP